MNKGYKEREKRGKGLTNARASKVKGQFKKWTFFILLNAAFNYLLIYENSQR